MGSTFYNLSYHIVFSTKERTPYLSQRWRDDAFAYLGGTVRSLGGHVLAVGGVEDHVHLLVTLKPALLISDFVRDLKKGTSIWASTHHCREFAWQEGYAIFSVSASRIEAVRHYIDHQEAHHRKVDFLTELRLFLEKHGVSYSTDWLK